jgi:predicted RNase H-like HicB family nuclease
MIPDGYRVVITYDAEHERFLVRVPELDGVQAEGATRAEALGKVEEAIEATFHQAAEAGKNMPTPIDRAEWSGELSLKVSASLHRELAFLARQEGLELDALCGELLTMAVGARAAGRPTRPASSERRDDRGGGRRHDGGNRGGRGRGDYHNIMDDRAAFIEYVRSIGTGGGPNRSRSGRSRKDEE